MLPEGVLRTAMGIYVLANDISMSRYIEVKGRLNLGMDDIRLFANYVPVGGVVVEAGSFLGEHAEVLSQLVGVDGHVHAFEPHPITFQALKLNMARLNNVTVYPYALGHENKPTVLFEAVDRGCSCLLPPDSEGVAVSVQRDGSKAPMAALPVEVRTLDSCLLPNLARCDLLHLDAEGGEPFILGGAKHLIKQFKPAIVMEVGAIHLKKWNITPEQVFGHLNHLGYTGQRLNEVGDGDGLVYNVLALPNH